MSRVRGAPPETTPQGKVPPVAAKALPAEATPVPAAAPKTAIASPSVVSRTSPWKSGLKAGGKAAAWMVLFAALDYFVHESLRDQLEKDIELSRRGMHSWAVREKAKHPDLPVYFRISIVSEEYSRYSPLLGWMPEPPKLFLSSIGLTPKPIEEPTVSIEDHSMNPFFPGKTTSIIYTELIIP